LPENSLLSQPPPDDEDVDGLHGTDVVVLLYGTCDVVRTEQHTLDPWVKKGQRLCCVFPPHLCDEGKQEPLAPSVIVQEPEPPPGARQPAAPDDEVVGVGVGVDRGIHHGVGVGVGVAVCVRVGVAPVPLELSLPTGWMLLTVTHLRAFVGSSNVAGLVLWKRRRQSFAELRTEPPLGLQCRLRVARPWYISVCSMPHRDAVPRSWPPTTLWPTLTLTAPVLISP
jgi:hypothetical protein